MARGNSSRASSELSDEKDYKKNLVDHFRELGRSDVMPELKGMKAADLKDAARYVADASEEARDYRDDFDKAVTAAKAALEKNTIDWTDRNQVARILPMSREEIEEGLEPDDIIQSEWEDNAQGDPAYDDAVVEDREYEDAEGEPASLRGNSAVDAMFASWAKDFVQERVDSSSSTFTDWQDEVNTVEQNALENWINEREKGGEV